jgi:ParB family transcriptional regulator, chromosome partitioning protein
MAKEAEWLLEGTDWLPEPLRTPEFAVDGPSGVETGGEDEALPAFLAEDDEMKSSILTRTGNCGSNPH